MATELEILEKKFEDLCIVVEEISRALGLDWLDPTSELQYGERCDVCAELIANCTQNCSGNQVNQS